MGMKAARSGDHGVKVDQCSPTAIALPEATPRPEWIIARTFTFEHLSMMPEGKAGIYGMCRPEIMRAITRRWISEVPSKIV
jgi:hypothetical protein